MGIDITTTENGELVQYDKFRDFLKELEKGITSQADYSGFPSTPNCYYKAYDLYNEGTDDDKKFMFGYLYSLFVTALTHWKVDMDYLWTEEGKEKYNNFLKEYDFVLKYCNNDTSSFNIGI